MTWASSDLVSGAADLSEVNALRRLGSAVEDGFPGCLRSLVLFGSRPRRGHELEVAVLIEGFDHGRDGRRLSLLAAPFHHEGFAMPPIDLPADRRVISPELLANIDRQGARLRSVRRPGELLREEPRLAVFVTPVRERLSTRKVWVFGSRASGTTGPTATGISS